jgi:hypothetical protein
MTLLKPCIIQLLLDTEKQSICQKFQRVTRGILVWVFFINRFDLSFPPSCPEADIGFRCVQYLH